MSVATRIQASGRKEYRVIRYTLLDIDIPSEQQTHSISMPNLLALYRLIADNLPQVLAGTGGYVRNLLGTHINDRLRLATDSTGARRNTADVCCGFISTQPVVACVMKLARTLLCHVNTPYPRSNAWDEQ
ncbi:hypothetical protein ACGC1H_000381 [Rhizoctonia solani]